jgi:hypothetical protein
MAAKHGPDKGMWPEFDTELWVGASGGKAHGRYYGVPSIIDSKKLPSKQKSSYPILDNAGSSHASNSV